MAEHTQHTWACCLRIHTNSTACAMRAFRPLPRYFHPGDVQNQSQVHFSAIYSVSQQNNHYILILFFPGYITLGQAYCFASALFFRTVISCAFSKDSTNCFMNASTSSTEAGTVMISLPLSSKSPGAPQVGMSSHHNYIHSHSATSLPWLQYSVFSPCGLYPPSFCNRFLFITI